MADTLDPVNGLETNGFTTHTLWGELGAQLSPKAYEALRRSDEERTAPSKETIAAAVGDEPTIIIIDEIAQHLRQLASSVTAKSVAWPPLFLCSSRTCLNSQRQAEPLS